MLDPESEETVAIDAMPSTPRPAPRPDPHRFAPGTLLARRYRIVSRLGKGGMGEVFRADDIVLGQPVALKFLPETAITNANFLTRFYDEVRIARQISHPNVCRVYDIGEMDGQPYLSMEYIDGEDLASLLRRIGRLPGDKAAEFARKICAGVAAAHAQGVLHRDIKPGNIMIDGRGEPRITDFGLAAVAEGIAGAEIRNGTPAYMAPEQLEGREVSALSDVYALGLVLYEMFTGKVPHEVTTLDALMKARMGSTTPKPSTLVPDLDPAADRAIQACLQANPNMRPKSALDLARMLPGGDPLAMALAAGETPSPEMVAAAGSCDHVWTGWAIAAVAITMLAVTAAVVWASSFQIANHTPLERPEVLESKARELIRGLGYVESSADSAVGFRYDALHRNYQSSLKMDKDAWIKALSAQPSPITFWYRQSPAPLAAQNNSSMGRIQENDPAQTLSGMIFAEIAMDGRLLSFTAVAPEKQAVIEVSYDWSQLFGAAKLDIAKFAPAIPEWTPVVATDQRAAWVGDYPGKDTLPVRIEAGAFQGKPVYFSVIWPWTPLQRTALPASAIESRRSITEGVIGMVVILVVIITALMARSNVKEKRVDFRGATRLAMFLVVATTAIWMLWAHHSGSSAEQSMWFTALADAVNTGALVWGLYLALEPWVRRYWPQAMITWSRIIAGGWRDPMVGRDIMIALVAGTISAVYFCFVIGRDVLSLGDFQIQELLGTRFVLGTMAANLTADITAMLLYFMMIFLLRLLLRNTWAASAAFVVLWCVYRGLGSWDAQWWVSTLYFLPVTILFVVLLHQFGFLATVLSAFVSDTTFNLVMTSDLTAWYGQSTLIMILAWVALAAYGLRLAVGEKSLWSPKVGADQGYNR